MNQSTIWPRPKLIPLPENTCCNHAPVQSLNGIWKFCLNPEENYWLTETDFEKWYDIEVPSTLAALGIRPENRKDYAYRTTISIPASHTKMNYIVRFSAVNCEARIWIDGHYIRSHYGGFNTWDADISQYVTPGQTHTLTVGVQDSKGLLSQFHYGGIIRNVDLITVPICHFEHFHILADLDSQYRNGFLSIYYKLSCITKDTTVKIHLFDPHGNPVQLSDSEYAVSDTQDAVIRIPIETPYKWDAEHPNLYCLEATIVVNDQLQETTKRKLGFRKIERKDDQVFINGKELKLRGVDREEVHPLTGRTLSREDIKKEILLYKNANINFIRTSHYNPTQYFLELCDEYGIYVEEENSVSFVGQGQNFTNDDPEYLPHYMNQFTEMIEMDYTHPCIIMWSLGNESMWGSNLRTMLHYAKETDPDRLIIFSYPITLHPEEPQLDVWSAHYAEWYNPVNLMTDNNKSANTTILQSHGPIRYPVLHDEYAHPSCYNHRKLVTDQTARDFWGESIDRFWDSIYHTKGALGGAIWNGIDEVWLCKDHTDEIFEWGIIDGYRREKPEHWNTKKAYSPVRLSVDKLAFSDGKIVIPIENRYNHTNLRELTVICETNHTHLEFSGPDLEPRMSGELTLPEDLVNISQKCIIHFKEANGIICDSYLLSEDMLVQTPESSSYNPLSIEETDTQIRITGCDYSYCFEKKTGYFSVTQNHMLLISKGSWLHLDGISPDSWKCESFQYKANQDQYIVNVYGTYDHAKVNYCYRIAPDGILHILCYISDITHIAPARQRLSSYGFDAGGYQEVGIAMQLTDYANRLKWDKRSKWCLYPDSHIGREHGIAWKFRNDIQGGEHYRQTPYWLWKDDMADYALFGKHDHGIRPTRDFTSLKTHIKSAEIYDKNTETGFEILSDGSNSIRLEWTPDMQYMIDCCDSRIHYSGNWHKHFDSGCLQHTEMRSNQCGDTAEIVFEGTGISWIAKQDIIYGRAKAYVDGKLIEPRVSCMPWGGIGLREGAQNLYQEPVFTIQNLPYGKHTLKIVVSGEPGDYWGIPSLNCYVSIDAFLILGEPISGKIKLMIDQEYNYPDIAWGNYVDPPLFIESGYCIRTSLRPFQKKR